MSDNFDTMFEGDVPKGTRVSYNQSGRNGIADSLNIIGNVIFILAVILSVAAVFGSAHAAGKIDKSLVPIGIWLGVVSSIYSLVFFYIIKILFNGFAELIQISHDTRREIRSLRKDIQGG